MSEFDRFVAAVYRQELRDIERLATPSAINARDEDGRTPLMHAVLDDDANPEIVTLLVRKGADVNATDAEQKWTALHFAARDQKKEIVRALLSSGADVHAVDVFGNTPLWRAAMHARPDIEIVRLLLASGSDP